MAEQHAAFTTAEPGAEPPRTGPRGPSRGLAVVDVPAGAEGAWLLQRAEARAALSSEALLLLDEGLRVLAASPSCARVLGRSPGSLAGRPLSACADDGDAARVHGALASLLGSEGARGRWDMPLRGAAGATRTFDCRAANLLADDAVGALVVVLRDVHDQRVTEQALRRAHDQLSHRLDELTADRAVDAALSRVADLLQHCTTAAESHDVVWSSLPALLPGLSPALYFESDDRLDFVRHRGDGALPTATAPAFLAADTCWALRTRRSHVSASGAALRCDHVEDDRDAACLPLLDGGHAFGLVVVTPAAGGRLPAADALERLAGRLGVTLANARVRRVVDDR